jgi:pSer/pThr/pTyr-binding forkhead associated (FHA) protein
MSTETPKPIYPSLRVYEPDGEEYTIWFRQLLKDNSAPMEVRLGRDATNSIALKDPEKRISRDHCLFRYVSGRWQVEDSGSVNGTFVRSGKSKVEIDVRLEKSVPLKSGDEILIPGIVSDAGERIFWRLVFSDPDETVQAWEQRVKTKVEYSLSRQQLFLVTPQKAEVKLSPLERKLIDYMARRNWDNKNQPIVCNYQELIAALWEDSFGKTNNDVNGLALSIRKKIEQDSSKPEFLKTVKGAGYLFEIELIH